MMATSIRSTEKVGLVNDEDELRKHGYVLGTTLGEGSYAKVKSAYSEKIGRKVALKIINRRKAPKDFQQKFLPRELEVMKMIHHPNVVQLYEVMQFNGKVFIAMEIAGHGDILEYIKLRGAIQEDRSRAMFQQLVNAVEYLHSINIVHRDLKCENVLLDTQNVLKVTDFGFARLMLTEDMSKTFCGSAAYAAPEILQGIPYKGPSYDIWSLGVVLYIMVCGTMPYDDSNIKKMIRYQTERKVGFSRSRKLSTEVRSLIHSMLEANIKNRATMATIQGATWLQQARVVKTPPQPQPRTGPAAGGSDTIEACAQTPAPDRCAPTPAPTPMPTPAQRTDIPAGGAIQELVDGVKRMGTHSS